MEYSDQKPLDLLLVDIFGKSPGTFTMYEDDGLSLDHLSGQFAKMPITYTTTNSGTSTVNIGPVKGSYKGQVSKRGYTVHIHGITQPNAVTVNGHKLTKDKWAWENTILTISMAMNSVRTPITITIK